VYGPPVKPHNRLRRAGDWLGIMDTRPKPTMRQSLRAGLFALPAVFVAAGLASLVERAGGPGWVMVIIMVTPIWLFVGLLERRGPNGG
jgi:hypothetical protein